MVETDASDDGIDLDWLHKQRADLAELQALQLESLRRSSKLLDSTIEANEAHLKPLSDVRFFEAAVLAVLTGCAKTLQPELERTLVESAFRIAGHAVEMRRERLEGKGECAR